MPHLGSFTRAGCLLAAALLLGAIALGLLPALHARAFSNGQPASLVLGQPDFTSKTTAAGAQGMAQPKGVEADGSGNLWVSDTSINRVLRFDSAAAKANGAPADGVLGQPDFTSGAPATTAQGVDRPSGLALDSSRLWAADTGNRRVLLFDWSSVPTDTPTSTPSSSPTATSGPTGTPTATATPSITTTPTGPGDLPDLTITGMAIGSETNTCPQTPLGLLVRVANIGSPGAGPFTVTANGATRTVDGLAPGQSRAVWFPSYAYGNLNTATADSAGQVLESDEGNNTRAEMVPIPTPLYCPSPTPSETSPLTPSAPGRRLFLPLVRH
jgi:hypothetical protein